MKQHLFSFRVLAIMCLGVMAANVFAGQSAEDLAKAAQNPIAAMISVPLQYNLSPGTGPLEKPLHILNVQPVIPFSLNDDWNLISRTIFPIMSSPAMNNLQDRVNGLGDIQMSLFISPSEPTASGWILGAGIVGQFDTHTNGRLNMGGWGRVLLP